MINIHASNIKTSFSYFTCGRRENIDFDAFLTATLKTKAVTAAGIKVSGVQGKITCRRAKGGSGFTVNKTTGKITIKKITLASDIRLA